MSVSIQSETSKEDVDADETVTEDAQLEDLIWNLMSKTGLLSQIQGQVSKFIEDNGKPEKLDIIPERANARILGYIFEYLQWLGMKQTNSVLLSESPVEVDLSIFESRIEGPDYKPDLCKILESDTFVDEEEEEEEDKASPTRSQHYSRDEFDDSKLTSSCPTGQQSEKSSSKKGNNLDDGDEEDDIVDEASDIGSQSQFDENVSAQKLEVSKKLSENQREQDNITTTTTPHSAEVLSTDYMRKDFTAIDISPYTSTPRNKLVESEENASNENLINLNSPAPAGRGFDNARSSATLRQNDEFLEKDPFQSPVGAARSSGTFRGASFQIPVVTSNDRLDFVDLVNANSPEAQSQSEKSHTSKSKTKSGDRSKSKKSSLKSEEEVHKKSTQEAKEKSEQHKESLKDASQLSPGEESTSDFMETLSIEDDTQDVSIASGSKGMSSCEHAVSFK